MVIKRKILVANARWNFIFYGSNVWRMPKANLSMLHVSTDVMGGGVEPCKPKDLDQISSRREFHHGGTWWTLTMFTAGDGGALDEPPKPESCDCRCRGSCPHKPATSCTISQIVPGRVLSRAEAIATLAHPVRTPVAPRTHRPTTSLGAPSSISCLRFAFVPFPTYS
jgi:hypothetical protein